MFPRIHWCSSKNKYSWLLFDKKLFVSYMQLGILTRLHPLLFIKVRKLYIDLLMWRKFLNIWTLVTVRQHQAPVRPTKRPANNILRELANRSGAWTQMKNKGRMQRTHTNSWQTNCQGLERCWIRQTHT